MSAPVAPRTSGGDVAVSLLASPLAVGVVLALVVAVTTSGRFIPTDDVYGDWTKGVLWALALGATIPLWPVSRDERRALLALWGLRCIVTLGAMLLYEGHYEFLDAYGYYAVAHDESLLYEAGAWSGTRLMQDFSRWHARWLFDSYHAMKVTMAMAGLVGTFLFYRAAAVATGRRSLRVLVGLSLVPSIIFWSSIFGKDPIAMLAIATYSLGAVTYFRTRRPAALVPLAAGLLVASIVRLWLAPMLLVPVMLVSAGAIRGWGHRILAALAGSAALALAFVALRDYFALAALRDALELLNANSQSWAEGGSAQLLTTDFTDPVALIRFLPAGMFTALFRPLPGDVMNAFGLLAGVENVGVLALLALAVWRTRLADFRDPVVSWATMLILLWAGAYAPISYQNLGTASRFRLQILPVMILLLVHLARRRGPRGAQAASSER